MAQYNLRVIDRIVVLGTSHQHVDPSATARILFLDRDGVLNIDTGYPSLASTLLRTDVIASLLSFCDSKAISHCFLVSNQSGVARGLITFKEAVHATLYVLHQCLELGLHVEGFCLDMSHPTGSRYKRLKCISPYRKPNPGMLQLFLPHHYDADNVFLWGDKQTDLQAALALGIPAKNLTLVK